MSRQTRRGLWSLLGASVVGVLAVSATMWVATASARSRGLDIDPRLDGYERYGRLWVKPGQGPSELQPATQRRTGYRRQGRVWIKDGQRPVQNLGSSLVLTKTVGLDPNTCASTDTVAVPANTDVTYCFEATNIGQVTLTSHDLVDDQLGTILSGFPFDLNPGSNVFVTASQTMGTMDVLNTGTWTGFDDQGGQFSDSDTALVTILQPSIVLTKTVGLDPNLCAATDMIDVLVGTEVTYCYEVGNSGLVTLTMHDLVDDQLGTILTGFGFPLAPGAVIFITQTATINSDVVNTGTWTAYNPGPVDTASDMDTAEVTTMIPVELTAFDVD